MKKVQILLKAVSVFLVRYGSFLQRLLVKWIVKYFTSHKMSAIISLASFYKNIYISLLCPINTIFFNFFILILLRVIFGNDDVILCDDPKGIGHGIIQGAMATLHQAEKNNVVGINLSKNTVDTSIYSSLFRSFPPVYNRMHVFIQGTLNWVPHTEGSVRFYAPFRASSYPYYLPFTRGDLVTTLKAYMRESASFTVMTRGIRTVNFVSETFPHYNKFMDNLYAPITDKSFYFRYPSQKELYINFISGIATLDICKIQQITDDALKSQIFNNQVLHYRNLLHNK